jgi:CDP-glucose 4,6-dehydratase
METELTGYSLAPPTSPSLFELARVADGMESITGDIRDLEHLTNILNSSQPEIVIHMAAQSLVRQSYLDPVETYHTNVMGTVNLLEAVRRVGGVKAVLVVTSDKCYENREWVWGYRESDAVGGFDPYSNSKGCAELVTSAYRQSFFNQKDESQAVGLASVRAGNVFGGGDWAKDRLVPDVIQALMSDQALTIRHPSAVRPWQHVLEPLSGYLLLTEKLYEEGTKYSESWNLGPDDEDAKAVSWIVRRLINLWGGSREWHLSQADNPHEAHYLKLDCSKAKARLGWSPRWNIEKGLEATVEWYKALQASRDMRAFAIEQIQSYQSTASLDGDAIS